MNLTTAHSLWLAPLCLALGVLYAWVLYRRASTRHGWSKRTSMLLGVLRAAVVALLAFFLLEPMVRVWLREVRKPVVVVAHDGSSSLLATGDTAAFEEGYRRALDQLTASLADRYEVRSFTYGQRVQEGLHFEQEDGQTDMDQLLRELRDRFSGPDLGVVIVDGDGIYNRGRDPRFGAQRLGVPVYTIALGDTTVRPDLVLKSADHNRIAFLGNEFPVVAHIEAWHLQGGRSRVSVRQGSEEIVGQDVRISGDPWFTEVPLLVKTRTPGLQRFTVTVRPVEGETHEENNVLDIYVDVVDDRQKILLLAEAPHPDIAALRQAMDKLEGYQTEVAFAGSFTGRVEDYDLIVLHQLPSRRNGLQDLLQRCAERKVPVCFVMGQLTDLARIDALGIGLEVSGAQRSTTDAQAAFRDDFGMFTLTPEERRMMERWPPLQVPFAHYEAGVGAAVLASQRVGVVRTDQPLIVFLPRGEQQMAAICGEGLWRWRLADQQQSGAMEHFDILVHKVVQLLALKVDKSRFRVQHAEEFAENEPVILTAELYNAALERVNTSEAVITLKDEEGRDYPYTFSRTADAYRLDAGTLPSGRYSYSAHVDAEGERLRASGEFLVKPLVAELQRTVADHMLLADIAATTGGRMFAPDRLEALADTLASRKELVSRSYSQASFTDLIGLRWIFFVLLTLLAAEWALRRWSGAY